MTPATMKKLLSSDRSCYGVTANEEDLESLAEAVNRDGGVLRFIDAASARTVEGLFASVAAAFEFPDYFGSNWAAFDECLADLDWLPTASAYVLVLLHAREILADESTAQWAILLKVLDRVASEWASPVELGEWWDRPARPFHALFHEDGVHSPELAARFRAADHELEWVDLH